MFGAVAIPASAERTSQPAVNEWCPVMTEETAHVGITTVYKDKTVAFCCDTCLNKFLANVAHDAMRLSESLYTIVDRHQIVSKTAVVITICLSALRLWRWSRLTGGRRWTYGCCLLIACGLLGYTGYLGGSLVFGPDQLAW